MNLNYLYDKVESEKINLITVPDNIELNGMFITHEENNIIGIKRNVENERSVLAEELGHYYKDAVCPLDCTDMNLIRINEYRAKQYAYKILIPKHKLELLLRQNYNKYEIAEILDVSLELLELAYNYYIKNGNK